MGRRRHRVADCVLRSRRLIVGRPAELGLLLVLKVLVEEVVHVVLGHRVGQLVDQLLPLLVVEVDVGEQLVLVGQRLWVRRLHAAAVIQRLLLQVLEEAKTVLQIQRAVELHVVFGHLVGRRAHVVAVGGVAVAPGRVGPSDDGLDVHWVVQRRDGRHIAVGEAPQRVQTSVLPYPFAWRVAAAVADAVLLAVERRSGAVQLPLHRLLEL